MSFSESNTVNQANSNPASGENSYFSRRPSPQYRGSLLKQTVNISASTRERVARTKLACTPRKNLAYNQSGVFAGINVAGQVFSEMA